MAKSTPHDASTPQDSNSELTAPESAPMIINGEVIDARAVDASEYVPPMRPRNGLANAGLILGIASLIMNPFGVSSLAAIVMSIAGLRRSIALYREGDVAVGRMAATTGLAIGVATAIFAIWVFIADPQIGAK